MLLGGHLPRVLEVAVLWSDTGDIRIPELVWVRIPLMKPARVHQAF